MRQPFFQVCFRALLGCLLAFGLQTLLAQDFAYVANTQSNDVSVIDLTNGTVIETIAVEEVPVDVAASPNGNLIAVTNAVGGSISLIDPSTNAVINTFPTGNLPSNGVFGPDGTTIYQSFLAENRVEVFDLDGNSIANIDIPGGPTAMALRPGTDLLYVVRSSDGALGAINVSTNEADPTIDITLEGVTAAGPTNPFSIAISEDGNTAVVPNSSSGFGNVVDLTTGTVSRIQESFSPDGAGATDAFLGGGIGAAISGDFGLVVEESAGELSFVDLTNNNVIINTFTDDDGIIGFGATTLPIGVAVNAENTTALVTLSGPNQVAVVDLTDRSFTTIDVGDTPRRLAIVSVVEDQNIAPSAAFTSDVTSGTAPLTVSFDASTSSDDDGEIIEFAWDFGDGNTATGETASNTFTQAGTFTVTLTVTDDDSATATATATIEVSEDNGNGGGNGDVAAALQEVLDDNILSAGGLSASVLLADGSIETLTNGIAGIGVQNDPAIKFGVADFSSHLMAVLTLRLVEEGTFTGLDEELGAGVVAGPPTFFPTNTTLEQLLNHTSGINNFAGFASYFDPALSILFGDLTTDYSALNYTPILSTFVFPQGPATPNGFEYSNTNYLVLGEKIEQTTGQSLQELLQSLVLDPAGIAEGDVEFFLGVQPQNISSLFVNISGILPEALSDQTSILTSTGASGSVIATPEAVAQYMAALFAGDILSASSIEALTSFAPSTGRLGSDYGLGTELFTLSIGGEDQTFVGHTGNVNYKSAFIFGLDLGVGAFVTTNNNEVSDTTILEIARLLVEAAQADTGGTDNIAPVAAFSATPDSGTAPLTVVLEADDSSDEDGTIETFAWDFGDGNTATGDSVTNTFDTTGVFTVTLIVTDNGGASDTATATITVSPEVVDTADVFTLQLLHASDLEGG